MPYQHFQQMIEQNSVKPVGKDKVFDYNYSATAHYRDCGDSLTLYMKIENDIIMDIGFSGIACDICTASASIMCREMSGKHIEFAAQTFDALQNALYLEQGEVDDALAGLLMVARFPTRVECALLPWNILDQLIFTTEAA